MPQRTCLQCGSSWSSSVSRCVFCGGESQVEREPDLPEYLRSSRPKPAGPEPAAELEESSGGVAVAVAPEEPGEAPAAPSSRWVSCEPEPAAPSPAVEEPAAAAPPCETPAPPRPRAAWGTLVLGLAALAASSAAIPSALGFREGVLANLALLAGALMAPLAPLAWLRGLSSAGLAGRTGKSLGMLSTGAFVLGFGSLAVLEALRRLMIL